MNTNQTTAEKIREWLDTPPENRDIASGADMLLRLDRNRIAHRNITMFPDRYASHLEYQLKKHLTFILDRMTHEKVVQLSAKADEACARNVDSSTVPPQAIRRGMRPDHDSLPPEIQAKYDLAMDTRRRISQCHLKARSVMDSDIQCKDSELYPWVKEIITLDKKAHALFKEYDSYKNTVHDDGEQA